MRKVLFTALIAAFIVVAPFAVFSVSHQGQGGAGNPPGGGGGGVGNPPDNLIKIDNPIKEASTLNEFIDLIITNVIMPVGGVVAVVFIIYSGFLFATARGNEEKIKEAKRAFFYAVIGALILLGAMVISLAIQGTIEQIRT